MRSTEEFSQPQRSPRLEETRRKMRQRHMSIRTEESDLRSIEAFLRFERTRSGVWLPYAFAEKYPAAGRTFPWRYLFPAATLSRDPRPCEAHEGAREKEATKPVRRPSADPSTGT